MQLLILIAISCVMVKLDPIIQHHPPIWLAGSGSGKQGPLLKGDIGPNGRKEGGDGSNDSLCAFASRIGGAGKSNKPGKTSWGNTRGWETSHKHRGEYKWLGKEIITVFKFLQGGSFST